MIDPACRRDPTDSLDAILAEVAEDLTRQLQAGVVSDPEPYVARYPQHAEAIRRLLPDLERLADLGRSALPKLAGTAPPAVADPGLAPALLGDYRILREVGRGGMGVVYEAEQVSLGRRVALKVLPDHRVDPQRIRRFEREARAAGRLHHTNIVPVFGVGQENGTHYYVMQYIEGQPLDKILQLLRRMHDGNDRSRASTHEPRAPVVSRSMAAATEVALSLWAERFPERTVGGEAGGADASASASGVGSAPAQLNLRLGATTPEGSSARRSYVRNVVRIGIQIAQALEYAAGRGVIHRDIKPSNLLLDHRGTVWVADFGLAKVVGQESLTDTGDLLGTLRYLAPERLRGQVDQRSDLYSLGLTLYELLALRPAFGETDRGALIQQLTRSEPPRLERLDPAVPRDLATIVHQAIAREPADRYQTAATLASDLNRFLEDRPIAARRLGPLGVAWRWCRRNPAVASLLWLLGLLLVGGTIGSSVAAYHYNRLARSERAVRQATHVALRVADRHATEAQEVIGFFIDDMIGAATPEKKLGRPVSVDEVLARADRAIEGKFPGQPLVEASIRRTLGIADQKIGRLDQAERHLSRARDLRGALLGPEHPETLALSSDLAVVLRDAGRWEEARGLFERVGESRQRVLGPEHPDTLDSLGFRALLARDRDDQEQARRLFGELLEVRRRVLGPDHPSTLGTMNNLAFVLRYLGKHDQAGPLIDQVLEAQTRILGPEHPKTFDALENRGHWLSEANELDEARMIYERVLHGRRRHYGPDHADVIEMHRAIASILAGQGRWELASARNQGLLAAGYDSYATRFDLALLRLHQGDLRGYRDHCAAIIRQVGPGVDPRDMAWAARNCSLAPGAVDDLTIPLELARQAAETTPSSPSFQLARGAAAYRAGRLPEAVASLEKSRQLGIDTPLVREQADVFLAMALWRLDRCDEARGALAEADRLHVEWERTVAAHHGWPGFTWREWVIVEIALREARATAGQAAVRHDVSASP